MDNKDFDFETYKSKHDKTEPSESLDKVQELERLKAELEAKIALLETKKRLEELERQQELAAQQTTPAPVIQAEPAPALIAEPVREEPAKVKKEEPEEKKPVEKKKSDAGHKVLTVIGIIACVILVPILVINITLIAKSFINKDEVPMFAGIVPMIVDTDSMYPTFEMGDLVIIKKIDADKVKEGDIICFFDPEVQDRQTVITHRVIKVTKDADGKLAFETQGDANNTKDEKLCPAQNLVGQYKGRLKGLGNVALFMQSTAGLIIFCVLPILILVAYDMIRRRLYAKKHGDTTKELMAELEALKAEKAAREERERLEK